MNTPNLQTHGSDRAGRSSNLKTNTKNEKKIVYKCKSIQNFGRFHESYIGNSRIGCLRFDIYIVIVHL